MMVPDFRVVGDNAQVQLGPIQCLETKISYNRTVRFLRFTCKRHLKINMGNCTFHFWQLKTLNGAKLMHV